MNRLEVIIRTEVGWALNRLIDHRPTSLNYSDPEMVQRFTEVSSSYLHQGIEQKSIEGKFAQEITRQVDTVNNIDHFLIASLLMRDATAGLNTALRLTPAEGKSTEKGNPNSVKIVWQGTAREFGDDVIRRFECGELKATSIKNALEQECQRYVQKNGRPMNAASIRESLRHRKDYEGK